MDKNDGGSRRFKLLAVVEEGDGMLPWHGIWRHDGARNQVHTAVMPLNLLLGLAFSAYVWVKVGGIMVSSDPRAAFHDGYQAAVNDHPDNLREWEAKLQQRDEALDDYARRLGERESALRKQLSELRHLMATKDAATPAKEGRSEH